MVDILWNERNAMLEMLLYARQTRMFAKESNFNRKKFDSSLLHQRAIILSIAFIGEASGEISPATKSAFPQINWNDMIGMRNRLIHGYSRIDLDVVWNVVTEHLPPLIDALESIIPPEITSTQ